VLIAGVATFGLCGLAEATTKVSPQAYAAAVCDAVATLHTSNQGAEAALSAATDAYHDEPTVANATALRQALVAYLEQARGNFRTALTAFQKAGVPQGKNGSDFASALNENLRTAVAALGPVIKKAGAIDVSSTTGFATGAQNVFDQLSAASNVSKKQARQAAAFKHVAAALRPIVSYVRGSRDTCSST
jgi:hypothetical protein